MGLPLNIDLDISLAQLNPIVGDIRGNAQLVLDAWEKSEADLIVFSELVLSGYPPEDLILKPFFLDAIHEEIETICETSKGFSTAALIGTPWRDGEKIYNVALLIEGGEIKAIVKKHHLPNYGVFDEHRIFSVGALPNTVRFKGKELGIMICEDLWFNDVARHLGDQNADIFIVLNASPFHEDKNTLRNKHAVARATENRKPLIYVNQVGGQDELVFDGASFVLNEKGDFIFRAPEFESGVFNVSDKSATAVDPLESIYRALCMGIHDYVTKNGFPGVVLGMSGGIDSALTAAIAADALGADNVRCVMMPTDFTSQDSLYDAKACAEALGVSYEVIAIKDALTTFEGMIPNLEGLAHENIQSRIRGLIIMALSNQSGLMMLSTGNKSEMAVGYATLYGDMNGGFNALKDVYKTQVYALAKWRNEKSPVIPERIIIKAPTAELRDNQTDQDNLPDYEVLDDILECLIEHEMRIRDIVARGHDEETVHKVWRMLDRAEYKRRQAPPGVKITARAFGRDRRYPMTNKFGK